MSSSYNFSYTSGGNSNNSNGNNGNNNQDMIIELVSWVIIIACFAVAWPIGVILLIRKISKGKLFNISFTKTTVNQKQQRTEKYSSIISAYGSTMGEIPLETLANAAGTSVATVIRELQEMMQSGAIGGGAYINYITRSLVLGKNVNSQATGSQSQSAGTQYRSEAASNPAADRPVQNTAARPAQSTAQPQKAVQPRNTAQPKNATQAPKTAATAASGVRANIQSSFKDPYKATKILLLIAGIILLIAGVATISTPLDWLYWLGMDAFDRTTIFELTKAIGLILGGSVAIGARGSFGRKTKRCKKYLAIIGNKSSMSIAELASAVGVKAGTAEKELQTMVEKGYFGPAAYIDMGAGELVISPQARPQTEKAPEQEESQYQAILREIRRLNDDIADEDVSERIYRIEDITAKIFATVEEKPEKLPEIKSFMSYYLPTTLKLLDSYATMERQGIDGENIAETKKRIEHILDTLVKGFEQQLDQLFKSDMLDITSDIDVLESMMAKDGLTEEQNPFHQVGGH